MSTYLEKYLNCRNDLINKYDLHGTHFMSKYSVSTKSIFKNNKEILKFKYDDNCKFTYPWQFSCRGTTFIINNDIITHTYFSLNKFFNAHEIVKYYGLEFNQFLENLKNEGYSFTYVPKYDGSCMHCFTDKNKIRHRYTLGSLEKNKIGKSELDYYTTTELLLKNSYPEIYNFLDENNEWSLICELITPDNRVKTIYNFDESELGFLKPLVFINSEGLPTFFGSSNISTNNVNIEIKHKWGFNETNFDIVKNTAFNEMISNATDFGINPEGLVAYAMKDNVCFPIAKLKRPEYFQFVSVNEDELYCNSQIAKINNQIDDIQLTDKQQKHIDEFEKYLIRIGTQIKESELFKEFLTQRQFASKIESLSDNLKIYKNAFFQIRKDGFEFESEYDTMIKLLKTTNKSNNKTTLEIFQENDGYNWFKK